MSERTPEVSQARLSVRDYDVPMSCEVPVSRVGLIARRAGLLQVGA